MDDKCAHDWLPRSAHMSSHVQHTEAEERVLQNTHTVGATGWKFSAVWEPWRGPVCRNERGVEFIYSVRRSSYSHMDRPTVISLDCTAPNKSAPALTGLFLTCSETMM